MLWICLVIVWLSTQKKGSNLLKVPNSGLRCQASGRAQKISAKQSAHKETVETLKLHGATPQAWHNLKTSYITHDLKEKEGQTPDPPKCVLLCFFCLLPPLVLWHLLWLLKLPRGHSDSDPKTVEQVPNLVLTESLLKLLQSHGVASEVYGRIQISIVSGLSCQLLFSLSGWHELKNKIIP